MLAEEPAHAQITGDRPALPATTPKRKRRRLRRIGWTFLGLVAVLVLTRLVAGWVMESRLDARIEALRKAGEPVILSDLVSTSTADGLKAASLYRKAFEQMEAPSPEWHRSLYELARMEGPLKGDALSQARSLVAEFEKVFDLLREATRRMHASCEIDYAAKDGRHGLQETRAIAELCRFLLLSSRMNMAEGRPMMAMGNAETTLRLASSGREEPAICFRLCEANAGAAALRQIEQAMSAADPPFEALVNLRARFDDLLSPRMPDTVRFLRCERLSILRRCYDHEADFVSLGDSRPSFLTLAANIAVRPVIALNAVHFIDLTQGFLEAASLEPGRRALKNREALEAVWNSGKRGRSPQQQVSGKAERFPLRGASPIFDGSVGRWRTHQNN